MSRQHPWRADNPDAVIVARPTRYGNPFRITSFKETRKSPRWWSVWGWQGARSWLGSERYAREIATEEFRLWIAKTTLHPYDWHQDWIKKHTAIRAALAAGDLAGRDLACWCPLDQPCHADVLLELANHEEA